MPILARWPITYTYDVADMVVTLIFVNVKYRKHLLSQRIVCGCKISKIYITLIHIEINNIFILDTINIEEINNMNRNR